MSNQPRRKGFSFLSFFLGILIGIILIVGAVAGVVLYALNAKIDNVLGIVGIDNGKDENGKNQIINTDAESGGAETFMQLIGKVTKLAGDTQNLSVGEVENLIPAVGGIVDGFHGMLNEYLEIDRAELVSVKFSEFGGYVSEKLLDIEPAALMDKFGMGGLTDNKIMSLLLIGPEADYVEVGLEKYPVYYDVYNLEEGVYKRENDGAALNGEYVSFLYEKNGKYRINYYVSGETAYVVDEACTPVTPVTRTVSGDEYTAYTPEYATLSGNYYYENEEKIVVTPVTLRMLSDGGLSSLDEVYLTEFIASDDELANKVLGGVTMGDIMNGTVNINDIVKDLTIGEVIDPGENKILNALKDKKISEMSTAITELKLSDVMDISADDKILSKIKDATINTLPQKIASITINDLYADKIYSVKDADGNVKTPANRGLATSYVAEYLYYEKDADGNFSLVDLNGSDNLGKLTQEQFNGGEYYTYGAAQGEWKILLYAEEADGNSTEKAYTVNNMAAMIDNVSENMQKSSLNELSAAGVLQFPDGSLTKLIGGRELGTFTILEVINFVVALPST